MVCTGCLGTSPLETWHLRLNFLIPSLTAWNRTQLDVLVLVREGSIEARRGVVQRDKSTRLVLLQFPGHFYLR